MRTHTAIILIALSITQAGCTFAGGKDADKSECYVYVSVSNEKKIKIFRLDAVNEKLVLKDSMDLTGNPGSLCTDPSGKRMFAAMRSENSIACMNIDPETGSLAPAGTTPAIHNPVYISTDKSGKYLFSTSYHENTTAVYGINNGCLDENPLQTLTARVNPHMIKPDPSGRFLYIPNLGGDLVQQFIIKSDGTLEPNSPDSISVKSKSGPRHFIFHPEKKIFYLVNEMGCTVMVFNFDDSNGTLSGPIQEISTIPTGFTESNTCADIHVTPDGKFLYASNRGHNSLAAFAVNEKDGTLQPAGHYSTEKKPREFEIDPSGRFIISAGEGSGKIILYRIQTDGSLKPLHTYYAGEWPVWVLSVEMKLSKL